MKRIEQIVVATAVIGVIMKLLLLSEGSTVLGISLSVLAILYYPLGFFYFNGIPIHKIFKKKSYEGMTVFSGIGTFGGGLIFCILSIGILFKLLQLPGARVMLIAGLLPGILFLAVSLFLYFKNRESSFLKSMVIRTIVILAVSGILYATPGLTLVKVFHRNNPAYIEAYEELLKNPRDEELQRKAEELREKTEN